MVNQQNVMLTKNYGKSQTCQIKQKFRPPDASGGPGVKLLQISANRGINMETTYKTLNQDYLCSAGNSRSSE